MNWLIQLELNIISILKTKQNVACLKLFYKRVPKRVYAFVFFCPVSHEFFLTDYSLSLSFIQLQEYYNGFGCSSPTLQFIKRDDVLNVSVFLLHILSLVQVKKYLKLCLHFIANLMLWSRLLNFKVFKWWICMRFIYMIRY